MMDVVFVNPGNHAETYQGLHGIYTACEPPLWAGMLATFLRRKSISVDIVDATALRLGFADTAREVLARKPRLVCLVAYGQQPSASTLVMPGARAIAAALKELSPETPLLLLGGHVAALPERTLREESVDFVCSGEGPYTLHDLVMALREKNPNISKVRGLLYRDDSGAIVHNPPAPLVMNLEGEMPGAAWDLLPMPRYVAHNWHCFENLDARQPYASIYTSLGCPFHCSFCCIQAPFREGEKVSGLRGHSSYRMWPVESVLAQIDTLVQRYGVHNIKFADELFVFNKEHVKGICNGLIARGYDLNIWTYVRVDTWDVPLLDMLRKAGIRWLAPGIESGSAKVRKDVNKAFGQGKVRSSIAAFKKAGIYSIGNFLFGLPEDDMQSMRETLDFAKELNCEFVNMYCAMAYPGSPLYGRAVAENLPLPQSWNGYSQHAYETLPLPTRYLSGSEVLAFRDAAFHEYFSSSQYLDMIEKLFSHQVREHVEGMAAKHLPRLHVPQAS